MTNATTRIARVAAVAAASLAIGIFPFLPAMAQGTPDAWMKSDPCRTAATPGPAMSGGGMEMGTPMAGMDMSMMELDNMYIDMMIPHHASIVALSEAALPRLQDERLQGIAEAIVTAQTAEMDELRGYRDEFYGDPEPMPMDAAMMEAMGSMMPGMGSMEEMAFQMDAAAQVAAICGAEDVDKAFIDLVIPHHQMAIAASEPVVAGATREEIRSFAERVIAAQQQEIDELMSIREELYGSATPEPMGPDA